MVFAPVWTPVAQETYDGLKAKAQASIKARQHSKKTKATRNEGLFKQVRKCIKNLLRDPRHSGLETHQYHALTNPYHQREKLFEAHAQHDTPGACRVFWCYGPKRAQITILAITPHP